MDIYKTILDFENWPEVTLNVFFEPKT